MNGLGATSVGFLEDLYGRYQADPASVDYSWRCVFDLARELSERGEPAGSEVPAALLAELARQRGHLGARLDPLGRSDPQDVPLESHLPAQAAGRAGDTERLQAIYRSTLTVETAHIDDPDVRHWVLDAFENLPERIGDADARRALERLIEADEFEAFLARKYPTKKRFGAEGAEAVVALADRLIVAASRSGVREVVVGGMHRGRLNLMANVFGKPLVQLFAEFKGAHPFMADPACAADVPYHLGVDRALEIEGRKLQVTLVPNPSHLEAVDPVVLGRVRARQDLRPDPGAILGLVFHTDAAVVGQGIVAESLQLAGLPGFSTRGTIHVVVNNQLGFTTEPWEGRTARYCTGPWKAVDAPIIHVNGDDPEACLHAADLAAAYRQAHGRDIVIDLVCYRRNGHNELDEPRFTQPLSYADIDRHPPVPASFGQALAARGTVGPDDVDDTRARYRQRLEEAFAAASGWRPNETAFPNGRWSAFRPQSVPAPEPETGIPVERLKDLLERLATPPADMQLNPKVERLVRQRGEAATKGAPWSLGEGLAFASLVTDGVPVRLSGQDAVRGTFSSRHFGLVDTETGRRSSSIAELQPDQAPFVILNSPLSEYGVLGFEYGYSLERPDALVVWEAQFGDFANGAQIMIDQFITSGEEKWLQPSGLVMLVPHGLEGQGPEHSSARPERYLQMAARDNIQIANPSTPANYFHLLRRQVLRRARKPLIVLAPKTLLRLPAALSPLDDFGPGRRFAPLLASAAAGEASRLIFCTGKIAYELERERDQRGQQAARIVRLEMIYPLPARELSAILSASPEAELLWAQEEPENMGVWPWIRNRLEDLAREAGHLAPRLRYVGRPESPSPAGSFHADHEADQAKLVANAFTDAPPAPGRSRQPARADNRTMSHAG